MLRVTARRFHRFAITPRAHSRAKSTTPSVVKPVETPSSRNSPSATQTDQGVLKANTTPQVESPSTEKKKKVRSPTDPAADYQRLLEERFGGGEAAALGQLVDGKPEGLGRETKRNMFRLI
ncbi:hypothetical protein JCM16303_004706 [Sporobolomyces ruberrimus]